MTDFRENIAKLISKITSFNIDSKSIEIPPDQKLGDYAFPCFILAKELKKNPVIIAKELSEKISDKSIEKVTANGPYINFFLKKDLLAKSVLETIYKEKTNYGKGNQKEKIVIESPGPNTNKPLHLGHVRNLVLGNALENIFRFLGNYTIRVDIVNDRGIHICKSMLAYKKFAKGKEPDKKSDHFVGDYYVKYANEVKNHPEMEEEIKEMLTKWENDDKDTRNLWKKMNSWAIKGMNETYKRYGVNIEKAYYESDHYTKGKDIAIDALKKGLLKKDEKGNIYLTNNEIEKKIVLRADGTSIYITQDIALGKLRYEDYKMDKMIYVVASEQIFHFKALFTIFKLLGYKFADKCHHLSYGMVYLPEGKMKSREGTVVDADNMADEIHESALIQIQKRHPNLAKKESEKRAEMIGIGAIKFFILSYDPMKDFVFNPKESLSFEGETGPYVQYTHARICSILKKYNNKPTKDIDYSKLNTENDKSILRMLEDFPKAIENAAQNYKPSIITRYLLDLCQEFNNYYHKNKIIQEDKELEKARMLLIDSVRQVIKTGLMLLGVDSPNEM